MNTIIRQGDLMLRRIGDSTTTAPPTALTLAVGEESGHSHVLEAVLLRPLGAATGLVDVPELAELRVAGMPWRHGPIVTPPGRYEFWTQRELSEDEEVRSVQD